MTGKGVPEEVEQRGKLSAGEKGAMPPCARYLGVERIDVGDGKVWVTIIPTEAMCNPQGVVQGGILAGMLDDVMGATLDRLEPGRVWATASMTTHFLNPVKPGETLLGQASVVHQGRRVFFLEAWLYKEDGSEVARASATCLWQGRSARGAADETVGERRRDRA